MEDIIDPTSVTSSPEEVAIHFLLRHAECRKALTGLAGEERPHDVAAGSRLDQSVMQPVGSHWQPSDERPAGNAVVAEVTKDDSCTARFLRAYAAARHIRAGAEASRRVESATIQGDEAESWLKAGC